MSDELPDRMEPDADGWVSKFPTDFGVERPTDLNYSIVCPPRNNGAPSDRGALRYNFATADDCGMALASMLSTWAQARVECACGEEACFADWVRMMPVAESRNDLEGAKKLYSFQIMSMADAAAIICIILDIDPQEFVSKAQEIERAYLVALHEATSFDPVAFLEQELALPDDPETNADEIDLSELE